MFAIFFQEDRKLDLTDTNNLKHFNIHPTCTLNTYNKNYLNSLTKNLNPNNDISNGVTRSESIITKPIIQSGQPTVCPTSITLFFTLLWKCVVNCFGFIFLIAQKKYLCYGIMERNQSC